MARFDQEQLAFLRQFAAENGRKWRIRLIDKVVHESEYDPPLRILRNNHLPDLLKMDFTPFERMPLPKLKIQVKRFVEKQGHTLTSFTASKHNKQKFDAYCRTCGAWVSIRQGEAPSGAAFSHDCLSK